MKPPTTFQQIRESMGLNKKQLAKLMGVGRNTIARWERQGPTVCAMLAIKYLLVLKGAR